MSVKIQRLKIRMPAGTTGQPEAFARQIADGLAHHSQGHGPLKADSLHLRLKSNKGDMAAPVADALGRAVRGKGGR